jgi:hypothetical protein
MDYAKDRHLVVIDPIHNSKVTKDDFPLRPAQFNCRAAVAER